MRQPALLALIGLAALLTACSGLDPRAHQAAMPTGRAQLAPVSETHRDLAQLPPPKGRIVASVYSFRDLTGQYKQAPDSAYSTAVTQGAGSMLVKAMLDSKWFIPVEREGLQDLLTERRIIRAGETGSKPDTPPGAIAPQGGGLAGLIPASIVLEGGIIAYETNVKTGGSGARYFGIGLSDQYRTDQVTVNLRAVDIRSGRVLGSVNTTKTVYSYKLDGDVFRFVKFKRLLEAEAGFTRNEPAQLCVQEAIEAALIHLIVQGVNDKLWVLQNPTDAQSPVFKSYLEEQLEPYRIMPVTAQG